MSCIESERQILKAFIFCLTGIFNNQIFAYQLPTLYYFDAVYLYNLPHEERYDRRHVLFCIQGLVNRDAPRLFVRYNGGNGDLFWLSTLQQAGGFCENWPQTTITSLEELISTFRSDISGVVLYDPDPDKGAISSSLVATSVAAAENAIAVRKDTAFGSLYHYLVNDFGGPLLPVIVDLSAKFTGSGTIWQISTPSTGSKKCDAYIWLKEKYIDTGKCDPNYLSYTMDMWGLKVGGNDMTQLCNLDYAVSKKAICFELSPWGDEVPNDDPAQPPGTDLATFKVILDACNTKNNKQQMIQMSGFPNWPYKYTTYAGGSHQAVETEWEFIRLLSAYNVYTDVEFTISNTSFYSALEPAILERRYVQNPAPTYDEMVSRGLIDAAGDIRAGNYVMICMGDYDSPTWTIFRLAHSTGIYSDVARGQVYCNFGVNPNMINKASIAMDYMYRNKTEKDYFVAWDSGAGYVNPTQLYGIRSPSGYPSGAAIWQEHCRKYYRIMDYSISAWLLDGDVPLSSTDAQNYLSFSGDGIGIQIGTPLQGLVSNVPVKLRTASSNDCQYNMMDYSFGVNFAWYRAVSWNQGTQADPDYIPWGPDEVKKVVDTYTSSGHNHQFLDAFTFYYLLRYHLNGNNNYRATWISDTIPRIMSSGQVHPVTVTVRNDGWDTWSEKQLYHLGHAIVASGQTPAYSDYDLQGRAYLSPDETVHPGRIATFSFNITAPANTGSYDLYYDMVQENVTWFREKNNIEWKKKIIVATRSADIDTDSDGIPDIVEDQAGTLYWHPDDIVRCGDAGIPIADKSGPDGMSDCYVDLYDFLDFTDQWLNQGTRLIWDLSGITGTPDDVINLSDFSVLASMWLDCSDPHNPACWY